ncbi:MAG: InlB B-repeat-containing protein, partial [Oscillospiraceae bacterium]|nr:InlB B-repeat-containing protein [Oscillospiraceae bacterium]
MRKHKPLLKTLSVFLSFLMVMTSVVVGNPFAFTASAETPANAFNGLQVYFTSSSTGTTRLDRVNLKTNGSFNGTVYLRLKANSALTVTKITSSNANVMVDGSKSVSPNASLAQNAFATYELTASNLADSTNLEFVVNYTVGGSAATLKAYLYAEAPDDTIYHRLVEEFIGGVESSNFRTWVDANVGYFKLKQYNMADKYSDTSGFLSNADQTSDYGSCKCTSTSYTKNNDHFSSAYYYVDTSKAATWQAAGFNYKAVDSNTERNGNIDKCQRLKIVRIGLSKAFVNAGGDVSAEFKTDYDPDNRETALSDQTRSVYNTTDASSSWSTLSSGEKLFYYDTSDTNTKEDMPILANCQGANTFRVWLNGSIPKNVTNVPFHFMYRIWSDAYNIFTFDEKTTLSVTYYVTSYNKAALRSALSTYESKGLVSSAFDSAKWNSYVSAYQAAKKLLGDEVTNQASVDAAKAKLDRASNKLMGTDSEQSTLPPTEISSGLSVEPVVNSTGTNKDKPVTRVLGNSGDSDIGYVYYGTADSYATQNYFYIKATNHSLKPITVTALSVSPTTASVELASGGQTIESGKSAYFKVTQTTGSTIAAGDFTVTATYKMDILPQGTSTGVNAAKTYQAKTYFRVMSYATAFGDSYYTNNTGDLTMFSLSAGDDSSYDGKSNHRSTLMIGGSVSVKYGSNPPADIGYGMLNKSNWTINVSNYERQSYPSGLTNKEGNLCEGTSTIQLIVNKDKYTNLRNTGIVLNYWDDGNSEDAKAGPSNGYKIYPIGYYWNNSSFYTVNTGTTTKAPALHEQKYTERYNKNNTYGCFDLGVGTSDPESARQRAESFGITYFNNKIFNLDLYYPINSSTNSENDFQGVLFCENYGKSYLATYSPRAIKATMNIKLFTYSAKALAELVTDCNNTAFISAKYNSTLWSNYQTALKKANNVVGAYSQKQSAYDDAYTALQTAYEALKNQDSSTYAANVFAVDHNVWSGRAKDETPDYTETKYYLVSHGAQFTIPFIDGTLPSDNYLVDSSEAKGTNPTLDAVSDAELSDTSAAISTGDRYYNYDYWASAYTVRFLNYDGTEIGTQTLYYGDTPDYTWDAPVKASTETQKFDWSGWSLQKRNSDGSDIGSATDVGFELESVGTGDSKGTSYEYTAKFDVSTVTYNVYFLTHDGSALAGPEATSEFNGVEFNHAVTYSVDEQTRDGARTGYHWVWDGWSTADSASSDYDNKKVDGMNTLTGTVAVKEDIMYFAHFSEVADKYTITYNLNGGTNASTNPSEYTVEDEITLAAPAREGYTFVGWTEGDKIEKGSTGDKTFTAEWEANDVNYTVKHVRETLSGTYDDAALTETETLTGKSGDQTAASARSYEGFEAQLPIDQQTIAGNGSTVVTIRYSRKTFTVKYAVDGTAVQTDNGIKYGASTPAFTGATPTKEGYTFIGWGTVASTVTADATYNAVFEKNTYTVTYKAMDGKFADGLTEKTVSAKYGEAIPEFTEEPTPNKTGYHFDKWSQDVPATIGSQNITVEAFYAPDTNTAYKVETYKMNVSGSGYDKTESSFSGTTDTTATATAPEITGFTLNSSKSVLEGNIAGDGSLVLKIYYDRNQYNLTVDNDNSEVATTTKVYYEAAVSVETPTKTGYTFNGWDNTVPATMPANDVSLKAQWKVNQYTITFDTDGGSDIAPITQDYATAVTAPADPTKTGYTFDGWDKEIPATMPAENITVKAQWKVNQYTITFDTDGGSYIAPITQDYATAVAAPAAPTKTGYTFAGWDKDIPSTMPAENITVKAKWEANTDTKYTVIYLQQNLDNDEYTVAETAQLTGTTGDKAAVEIKSYNGFEVVSSYDNIIIAADGSTVIEVKYDRLTYTVNYEYTGNVPADATALPSEATYRYGATVTVAPNASAAGYDFSGWDHSNFTIDSNVTVKGSFTAHTYAINYVLNGGTNNEANPTSYTIESGKITLVEPTRTGYAFNGWSDGGVIEAGSTGDKTFTASWEALKNNTGKVYYKCGNDEIAPAKDLAGLETDATYTETPIEIAGYTAPAAQTITVKAGDGNDIIFTYTAKTDITATVKFVDESGNELADAVTATGLTKNTAFTYAPKEIARYTTPSQQTISLKADCNEIVYKYTAKTDITATVKFVDESGNELADAVTATGLTMNTAFTYAPKEIAGYNTPTQQTITLKADGNEIVYTYTAIANGTEYTVNYVYSDGTNEYVLETKTVTATAGDTVTVADLRKDFGGYTYDHASVADKTFTVAGDKSTSITLYYIIKDGDHEDNNPDSGDHYTITYDADGGELSGDYTTKYTVRDDITLATATKTGYVFNGWKVTKVEDASANSWTLDANLGK